MVSAIESIRTLDREHDNRATDAYTVATTTGSSTITSSTATVSSESGINTSPSSEIGILSTLDNDNSSITSLLSYLHIHTTFAPLASQTGSHLDSDRQNEMIVQQDSVDLLSGAQSVDLTVVDELYKSIMAQDSISVLHILEGSDIEIEKLFLANISPVTFCLLCANWQNQSQSAAVLRILLQSGGSVDAREQRTAARKTPLLMACAKGLLPIVEVLLSHGASPNHVDHNTNETPLQLTLKLLVDSESAISFYSHNLVQQALALLSSTDIDVTRGARGQTALELALISSHPKLIETIINKGHSHFHPTVIKRSLDLLNSKKVRLSVGLKEQLRGQLFAELEPDSLQDLCVGLIGKSMRRRLSKVSMLPCPNSMKEMIRDKGRSYEVYRQKSVEEIADEEQAMKYLYVLS